MSEKGNAADDQGQEVDRPELPEGWECCRIGDVAEVVGGSTPKSKESAYWGGEIHWIAVSDLTGYDEKHISKGARNITQSGYDSCATKLLPPGAVLFSSRAPIGYVAVAGDELCTSQGFKSFVLPTSLTPDYVYWYLKYLTPLAMARASGTTFKELSTRAAADLPLTYPPLEEQDRIVRAIETAFAAIKDIETDLDDIERLYEQHRRALLRDAFTGHLVTPDDAPAIGELDDQGWQKLPKGWEWKTLGEVGTIVRGLTFKKTDTLSEPEAGYLPVLRSGNVQDTLITNESLLFLPEQFVRADKRLLVGDLVVSVSNSLALVGKAASLISEWEGSFGAFLTVVRPTPAVRGKYLGYVARSDMWRHAVKTLASATNNIANINNTKLATIPIPLPPLDEQERIVEAIEAELSTSNQQVESLKETREALQRQRSSLLHKAFTGQLTLETQTKTPE